MAGTELSVRALLPYVCSHVSQWRKLFRPEEESKLKTKGGTDEANDDKIKTSKSRSGIVVMFAFPVYSCCRSSTGCV
ncbi:Os06g0202300 [Oryza sativa Japonica Group]|uniref:Os06g0202300 protein n=4 Tax=Oryza TaxID=4527 RepID=Q69SR5_ORYSJ|nr:uncharacterized protein LOC4340417 [Oryza sativa Japonica Group]ABR25408.1 unknown [Oryza sativa Indica Group]KAB8101638.1 hypothetical protein EE612_032520 [Oryza sativa]KAF2925687.1 hypothetical protein DAI22_06g071200 [Oryza sativa Japonica Group]BAD35603.1 unknown protein [Oryza sativa Japonica Group]BAD35970.1 unknown protein [Oryza sativa Japonica Group]|eukprot:NP_001057077.1 Os06g0202300 [Oryza sativa Japonica Group]